MHTAPRLTRFVDLHPDPARVAEAALGPAATSTYGGGMGSPLARRAHGLLGSVIDSSVSLLAGRTNDIVAFGMGSPAADLVPAESFARLAAELGDASAFSYGATEGEPELIEAIRSDPLLSPHAPAAERILVTTGGMQGLDLACTLFVDPGDLVVVEAPTYTNGSATALSYGADLLQVPCDAEGMDVDRLESDVAALGRTPSLIYTIPTFQNPSGTSMSTARKARLLELAHSWGAMVLDDDPYGALRFAGDPAESFHELSPDDPLVFSVRTFSKILAPGLRVGWIDADPTLRALAINAKQAMDTCTNVLAQRIIAGFLTGGGFTEHVEGLRSTYAERKAVMASALHTHLPGRLALTDPEGGLFLWATLTGDAAEVDSRVLFERGLDEGVALMPGTAFSPAGDFVHAFRLCFASSTPERIEEGVVRLARTVEGLV